MMRRRLGQRRLVYFPVGVVPAGVRAEVEDGLACAGIEFRGDPTGDGRVAISVAGGSAVRAEAVEIVHLRAGAR